MYILKLEEYLNLHYTILLPVFCTTLSYHIKCTIQFQHNLLYFKEPPNLHAYTCVHACTCDYPVENTGIIYIPSEKIPILEIFTVQQRSRVHNMLVFLPSCCNIIMLDVCAQASTLQATHMSKIHNINAV